MNTRNYQDLKVSHGGRWAWLALQHGPLAQAYFDDFSVTYTPNNPADAVWFEYRYPGYGKIF